MNAFVASTAHPLLKVLPQLVPVALTTCGLDVHFFSIMVMAGLEHTHRSASTRAVSACERRNCPWIDWFGECSWRGVV